MSTVLPPPLPASFADFKPAPKQAIQKVRYSHDAMIDMIVENPWISQGELARNFGYTESWVSQVIASNAFQARLAQRKEVLIDPAIRATIEERFKGLVARSIDILMKKLDNPDKVSDELALKALEVASKAAGYGSKAAQVQVNTSFVVAMPPKAPDTASWVSEYGAGGQVVDLPSPEKAAQIAPTEALVEPHPAAPPSTSTMLAELKQS